ncbi:MAG TPA: DUF882 domain-containing protein [Methylomirabilota bacterium]|nr:DUF882 domain-containing protein [Methylomirabilota bacterium]
MRSGCPTSRRRFLFFSAAAGAALVVRPDAASAAGAATRTIALRAPWSEETFVGPYLQQGCYLSTALDEIDRLFRDRHSQAVHRIDVRLLDLLYALQQRTDYRACFEVVCGYRTAATNRMLRKHGVYAARDSLHIQGQAVDVRFDGLPLKEARKIALDLRRGGVGYCPRQNFLHLDVGPVRSW